VRAGRAPLAVRAGDEIGTATGDVGRLDRSFAAELDSVAEARHLLTAWLRAWLGDQDRLIGDVALAVTEACNNVVLHAYGGRTANGDGEVFRLTAECRGDSVHVVVSDDGDGMTPRSHTPGLGLGLPLIATLSTAVKIGSGATGRGTLVAMQFGRDAGPPG
jgi:serine/threonine-protein kinase RsbW